MPSNRQLNAKIENLRKNVAILARNAKNGENEEIEHLLEDGILFKIGARWEEECTCFPFPCSGDLVAMESFIRRRAWQLFLATDVLWIISIWDTDNSIAVQALIFTCIGTVMLALSSFAEIVVEEWSETFEPIGFYMKAKHEQWSDSPSSLTTSEYSSVFFYALVITIDFYLDEFPIAILTLEFDKDNATDVQIFLTWFSLISSIVLAWLHTLLASARILSTLGRFRGRNICDAPLREVYEVFLLEYVMIFVLPPIFILLIFYRCYRLLADVCNLETIVVYPPDVQTAGGSGLEEAHMSING